MKNSTILKTAIVVAIIVLAILFYTTPVRAGTAQPLPGTTPEYPVVCTDDATGAVTLTADGRKVRVAYWEGDKPYFTDSNRSSRHKRTFTAPKGSTCRVQR